jgi:CIC family chloride channel protein
MISSLVQAKLSARLKYNSLYEAQVPTRADSPAHYVDEIRAGLSLIGKRKGLKKAKIGHLDLLTLLTSGIPIDLPDGRRMSVGTVKPGSPCVGTRLSTNCLGAAEEDYEIMAIFREDDVLLPHPNTTLRSGDRILVITSPSARARLSEHLDPVKKQ